MQVTAQKLLGLPARPDTLLRRVKQSDDAPLPLARIIGIDDWAWRKGLRDDHCRSGRYLAIDLPPGRDGTALHAWL